MQSLKPMASIRSLIACDKERASGKGRRFRVRRTTTYSLSGTGLAVLTLDSVNESRVLGVEAVEALGMLVYKGTRRSRRGMEGQASVDRTLCQASWKDGAKR